MEFSIQPRAAGEVSQGIWDLYADVYINFVQDVSLVHTKLWEVALSLGMPLPFTPFSLFYARASAKQCFLVTKCDVSIPLTKREAARESMQAQQENRHYKKKKLNH